jgi:hypothetical protein
MPNPERHATLHELKDKLLVLHTEYVEGQQLPPKLFYQVAISLITTLACFSCNDVESARNMSVEAIKLSLDAYGDVTRGNCA